MKFVRYGAAGREKPGLVDADGKVRGLSRVISDVDSAMLASSGLAKIKKANLKPVTGGPRPGIGDVRNFIAIGLNYSDHAAEGTDLDLRPEHNRLIPKESIKLDDEVELGIVIGGGHTRFKGC